ncbi:hypothetical protein LWI28_015941 [Acer negundo]|uniref:Uncharacterized protein n=1 Tax=Acer negundo TaxID=4023 RepID=A0AAD5IUM0_ACENE|nr:hypothetical protein LWI28_015941 [Acer negundo]KAK4847246.1 hypothetical protein QYF36_027463 [Acer negundo]
MESNRKRRVSGFVKGKLLPLYRVAKPSSATMQYSTSSKVKPSQSSSATASVGYVVHHQDYLISQPTAQKVSFIVPDNNNMNNRDKYLSQFETIFGVAGDECVDIKAASYISSVQERFKLERLNSERMK